MNQSKGQKKNKKAKKVARAAPVSTNTTAYRELVKLGGCTADYARCLVNPFDGPITCIPSPPVQMTRKIRTFCKGTFNTGTTGFGYVCMSDKPMVTNDTTSVWASNANFTGTTIDWNTNPSQSTGFTSNSDIQKADIGVASTQLEYRIVGSGLRIRYVDTELNRGGQLVGFEDPNHGSLFDRGLGDISGEEYSKRFPVDRNWATANYRPVVPKDNISFQSVVPTPGTPPATGEYDVFYRAFCVQVGTTASLTFEWEAYTVAEVFGKNVRGMSVSGADQVGFDAVQAVCLKPAFLKPNNRKANESEGLMLRQVAKYVRDEHTTSHKVKASDSKALGASDAVNWSKVGETVGDIALGAIPSLLAWLF